jgi:glucose/arabinose dehydrogenase
MFRPLESHTIPTPFISNTMKTRIFTGFLAALCVMLASCYPYPENPQRKKANQATQRKTAEEEAKIKEQEALKKQQEELKKAQETTGETTGPTTTETTPPTNTQPPVEQKRADYPFANKVPGKEGFVFSPYNNKVVDVRDIPSGTLVQDPTYPASDKKYFRVP